MKSDLSLAELRDEVEKLKILLDNPQLGLISWNHTVGESLKAICKMAKEAGVEA